MIINSINIYGFGKLVDKNISLTEGINIIEGFNEAGKSTIMAFIRAIFFGFEGRRNANDRYEPLQGGKFGGYIEILDKESRVYRIERLYFKKVTGDVKIYLPNGEVAGEDYLPFLLGKINGKVFKQIFSFGLTELQQVDSLQDRQINDFIYHIGTGSVNQILQMKEHLDQKKQKLFKTSGKKPEINIILNEVEQNYQLIEKLKQKNEQHLPIVRKIESLEKEIKQIDLEVDKNKKELDWLKKVQHYLGSYKRLKKIKSQLETYPDPFNFPDNGVERMESILEKKNEIEIENAKLLKKKVELENDTNYLRYDSFYEENEAAIINLREQLSSYQDQQKSYQTLALELDNLNEKIEDNLNQLGSTFTEEKLLAIDFTLQDKQYITELSNQIQNKQKKINEIDKEIEVKSHRHIQIKKAMYKLKNENNILSKDKTIEGVYNNLISNWQSLKELNWQEKQLTQQKEDYVNQKNILEDKVDRSPILYILIGLSLIISITLFVYNLWSYGILVVGFTLILSFVFLLKGDRSRDRIIKGLKKNIFKIDQQLSQIQQDIISIQGDSKEIITHFGLQEFNEIAIHKIEELKDKHLQAEQQKIEKDNRFKDYLQELEAVEFELDLLRQSNQRDLDELTELRKAWEILLLSHNMQANISPMLLFDMISLIQITKEWIKKRANLILQIDRVRTYLIEYEDKYKRLIANAKENKSGSIEESVFKLADRLKKNVEVKLKKDQIKTRLDELIDQLNTLKERIVFEDKKVNELLHYADVLNTEDFYKQDKRFKEYLELTKEEKQLLLTLRSSCNNDEEFRTLIRQLDSWILESLKNEIEKFEFNINKNKEMIKKIAEEKGQLQNQIKEIEDDQTLSELNQEYVGIQAKLKNKVIELTAVNLTKYILEKTMQVYETEKQPKVMHRASEYFNKLTGNLYTKIIAPIGSNTIEVIRNDGIRYAPQYLSRGTVEQLFIAMRFALVEEFSKEAVLPIILDDIFVNFDPIRLSNALTALQELAKDHQILFFTCHPHVSKKIQEKADDIYHILLN